MDRKFFKALLFSVALVVTGANASEPSAQADRFLSHFTMKAGRLAWENVRLGMSQRDVEKLLGTKLKLGPAARSGASEQLFSQEAVIVQDGLRVRLGFEKQGAQSYLQMIGADSLSLSKDQVLSLRKRAKSQLKGLSNPGPDFGMNSSGGDSLDISEHSVRLRPADISE